MLIGRLSHWNDHKSFGFVDVKVKDNFGWRTDRYFLHAAQITFQTIENVHEGCWVRFEVRDHQPRPGNLPYAGKAEVFETLGQLQEAEKREAVQS